MIQLIGAVLPLAVVVMVSPVNIIAAILLLFSSRPKAAAAAYLVGFALGVGAMLLVLDLVSEQLDWTSGSDTARGGAVLRIVLGLFLLRAAVKKLRARRAATGEPALPKWMDGIATMAPTRAAVTGLAIGALNPKNIAMAVAAAMAIGAAGVPAGEVTVVIVVYTVIASVGVAAPLVTAVALGDRATPVLERWRTWLVHNNDIVMAVLYLVFAAVLVGNGLASW